MIVRLFLAFALLPACAAPRPIPTEPPPRSDACGMVEYMTFPLKNHPSGVVRMRLALDGEGRVKEVAVRQGLDAESDALAIP